VAAAATPTRPTTFRRDRPREDLDRRVVLLHRNLEVRQGLDEDGVEAHLIAGGDPGGFGGAAAADEGRDDDRDA